MPAPTLTLRQPLAAIGIALVCAVPAYSSPDAVVLDYGDNGRVDAAHSLADLRGALEVWQDNPQYGAFADEVTAAMDRHLLGVAGDQIEEPVNEGPPRAAPAPPAKPPTAEVPASPEGVIEGTVGDLDGELITPDTALDALPSPPLATAEAGGPWALLLLAGAAFALLLAGVGTAALRRIRP